MDVATKQASSIELAAELTIAWLSNPNTSASVDDVPAFLEKAHTALNQLGSAPAAKAQATEPEYPPAVTVRKSLASRDHIISMIDGKPYKMLRRHLSGHGLSPDDYRRRYNLKPDYPMVSEAYSQTRSALAKKAGLGRKPGTKIKAAAKSAPTPAKRGRKPKAAAPQ